MKIRISNLCLFVVMNTLTSFVVWGAEEKNRILPEVDAIITTTMPMRSAMPRATRPSQSSIPYETIRVSGTTIAPRDGVFRRLDVDTLVIKKEISVTDFVITGTFFAGNIVAAGTLGGSQLTISGPASIGGTLVVGGPIIGNLVGNVTGNVVGNLLGDVTGNLFGNVIGNVSGAASLNVLKAGDTMTGSLRINNATAPALQLETNATSATNDFILAIDSSGNVTKSTVQIGSLGSSGTSSNVPGMLVQRDFMDGGFSAGTITALGLLGNLTGNVSGTVTGGLLGNVTGNVFGNVLGDITGNVQGNLVGNVLGNVTGNVAGNLLGDVTGNLFGNVIGNVSGASSLNVLKAGDTMTGQLRVSTSGIEPAVVITGQGVIAAPALQLLNNPPASVTDTIVGIDALGNITRTTIPIGTIAGGTSGNVPNTLVLRDGSGNFSAGTITADQLIGNISGNVIGNISGAASLNVLKSGDAMSGTLNMTTNNITNVGTVNGVTVQAHAARHLPSGADPLAVGVPVTIQTVNVIGSANAFSRSDHVHAHGSQSDPSLHAEVTDVQAGFMSAADKVMMMNATSGNVPNTLVLRDSSGNIAAQALSLQGLDVVGTSTFHGPVYDLFANVSPNNVLYVQKGEIRAPNQFNSVKAAMDSIVGSSATNPFVVFVGPGVYVEDTITLKPYVSLRGDSEISTIIEVDSPSKDIIIGTNNSFMRNLSLRGATDPGKAAIVMNGGRLTMQTMTFGSSDILMKLRAPVAPTIVSLVTFEFLGDAVFSTAFDIQGTSVLRPCGFVGSNAVWSPTVPLTPRPTPLTVLNLSGPGSFFSGSVLSFGTPYVPATAGTTGVQISNGATLHLASSLVQGFDVGFSIPAGGIAPSFNLLSVIGEQNTTDISIQNQLTEGSISGEFTRSKVLVDPTVTGLSVSFMEPTSGGITMVGPISTGRSIDVTTNISPMLNDGCSIGVMENGLLYTTTSSLIVTVSSGNGYLTVPSTLPLLNLNDNLKFVEWVTTTTILVPNTDNFLYINNVGQLQAGLSQPSVTRTIPLGKVRTNGSGALFVEQIAQTAHHTSTQLTDAFIESLGAIYVQGSMTSKYEDYGLSVSVGKYVYGTHIFEPIGATPISWQAFLGAGTNEFITTQTAIDWQNFDNGGVLDAVPTGSYAKHLLYVIGGVDQESGSVSEKYALVYSQTTFMSLQAAVVGAVPTPPSTWTGNIVQIAAIIVQNNPTTPSVRLTQILDQRPRLGFVPSSVAGASVHGNLLGLLADDHPQYLLTNGDRVMSGNLQMGGNQITNAGQINGVTIQTHASRHLPGSVLEDPLPMGVPVAIGTANALSQSSGMVNNFAYSDHVHAHGDLPGGGLHALVTTVTAGFMSNTDYITLANATSSNTPSAIVKRDANGNFAAGTITANLVGDISGNISGNLTVPAGSAAAPSIAFSGNTNTGIYSPGTNQVALTTNGTERFAVGATGTVTITGLNSAGVVHTDGSGNLSTSLIVNNDITNGTITNTKLATATSSNTPNYLVARDAQGNFAAGTITAGLIGNVTGNVVGNVLGDVTGNITGNLVGNVLGNVTGNVAGNLLGNVTGNVVGNVSGAASANVLKTGDTMTGTLRIENTTAPALQLFTNAASSAVDVILTIDSSGNVTRSTAQIGSLTGGTSSDVPNTLVLRDAQGNFAASTITAGLHGNVTGNVSGQVTGSLLGDVTGNVTGNLVGDVLGDVTGNVVGNVSGAASANVLKAGDTMTGTLRIENTIAPALQLLTNATSSATDDILTIDSSGNVTRSTATIGSLTGGTSSDVPNTLVLRDNLGNFAAGTVTAGLVGNVTGNVSGQVIGNLLGNVTGNVVGNVLGDVAGNVVGNLLGDLTGNVVGNVSGAASANVLKTGDTMTGTLRVSSLVAAAAILSGQGSTTAPALQLFNNLPATNTDNLLAIDGSGNVSQTTVPVGLLTGATSGNVPNTLVLRDGAGNVAVNKMVAQGLDVVGTSTFNSQVYNFFATVSPNNVLYVKKGQITAPNEFNSIKAAVDSIVGSSINNRFAVMVAPGIYIEDTITLQPYVGIIGINESSVVIQVDAPNKDIIHGADNAFLKGLTLQGATDPGMAAVSLDGGVMGADNINFGSSDILMKVRATAAPGGATITLTNVLGAGVFTTAFDIQSNDFPGPIYSCGLTFSSLTWSPSAPMASTVTFAKVQGPGSYLVGASLSAGSFGYPPTTGTKFLELFNGGFVEIATASVSGFDTAFSVPSGTTGSTLILLAIAAINNNTDISIQDQAVSGSISGEFDRNKITIDPAATGLALFITDGGITSVGSFFSGRSIGTITNISPATNYGTNLGVITGGEMYTNPASLVLTVSAGQGYLMQTTSGIDDLKLVSWATTQTILVPNKDNYVFIDNNGLPNVSLADSSLIYTIPLGKARASAISANGILYVQDLLQDASHTATKLANILELSLGPVYVAGSITSQNGATPSDLLNVTSGQYTFGEHIFYPVGGTPITWQAYLGSGTNEFVTTQTAVDFQRFDNGGALSSIPANYYATHLLYVIGGYNSESDRTAQTYALVYSQTVYSTLTAAEVGDLPLAPTSWTGNIVPIALVIVKNDNLTKIAEILDERPRPGFVASSIAGVTVHGNLLGLLADDHPQYLLANGGRTMTGNLQMGTNSISNVGTVNGVTVELHGARHGANNLDPIPTGVLADIQSIGITGAAGANNAFARADHVHAHGDLPGGTLHAVAGIVTAGFMSAADKQTLVNATAANTPGTLVKRNSNGDFAAGTITAGLIGNVTGNMSGNISGTVTGSLIGNVTGNVAGNVLGNLTGNVVGNISGAASANVLKVGDTMTGQLRISDSTLSPLVVTGNITTPAVSITGQSLTAAPALRLVGNPVSVGTDVILAIDALGNVTKSTVAMSSLSNSGTSSNVPNALVLRDAQGNFATGTITAGLIGNVTGNVSGQVVGSLIGNVVGNLLGDVTGNVVGNVSGAASANVLKVGDTMTGQLRISDVALAALIATGKGTTAAPALRLVGNPTSIGTDVLLGINGAGNVTETTFAVSGLGTAGTSGNVDNTLVLRDANGNFAAGTITAGLVGYHTGNMSGNLLGNVTGNVSGTVTGGLIGNVTGNVVGNVSGAASANVLKVGDTMTGQLHISDATTEALVLTGNNTTPAALITGGQSTTTSGVLRLVNIPSIGTTDSALAVDAGGNVTKSSIVTLNSAGNVTFGAGTAALPSMTFSGNTNTGLYSPTTNNVALTTNGTQRLLIDASGAVTINAPTANENGFTVTGNTIGASGAAVVNQGNNAASGSALIVNAAVNAASNPAVKLVGAANAADIMTITGAAGAGAAGRGLVIDKSQASASGEGLTVTSNTNNPATLLTGNGTTQAPALRMAGVPSLPSPSLTFDTTGYALTTDVTGNVMQSLGNNGETFRAFFSQPNWYRPIDPRREITFYDEFIGAGGAVVVGSLTFSDTNWKAAFAGGASTVSGPAASGDAFGVVRLTITNNANAYSAIAKNINTNIGVLYFGLGKFVSEMRVSVDQTNINYSLRIGYGQVVWPPVIADFVSGVYFEYTPATSANWLCKTANGSVRTTVDSGIPVTTSTWYKLRVEVNETGTAVNYYINDVLLTSAGFPITTNIPVTAAAACGPVAQMARTNNIATSSADIDYWYHQYVFNGVR